MSSSFTSDPNSDCSEPRGFSATVVAHPSVQSIGATESSVLIISLASVQEYLASARRVQDAWMGSFLFAHLMRTALDKLLPPNASSELILPSPELPLLLPLDKTDPDRIRIAGLPNVATVRLNVSRDVAIRLAEESKEAMLAEARRCVLATKVYIEQAIQEEARRTGQLPPVLRPLQDLESSGRKAWDVAWECQTNDWLVADYFWCVADLDIGDSTKSKNQAADLFESRKMLRDFRQISADQPGEEGHRCSLCGIRAAVGQSASSGTNEIKLFWKALSSLDRNPGNPDQAKLAGRLRANERLCAICVTKRLALEACLGEEAEKRRMGSNSNALAGPGYPIDRHQFPSTASIAAAVWKHDAIETMMMASTESVELKKQIGASISQIRKIVSPVGIFREGNPVPALRRYRDSSDPIVRAFVKLDDSWLHPGEYSSAAIIRSEDQSFNEEFDALPKLALTPLGKKLKDCELRSEPTSYYALIAADGDRMGDRVRNLDLDGLKTLSSGLRMFSLDTVPLIVEDLGFGRVIYAGGDDVLAMAPTAKSIAVLDKLQMAFETSLASCPGDGPLTLSVAMLVIHESEPLRQALEEVQNLLKHNAKDEADRNAFAVAISKRSGSPLLVALPWSLLDGNGKPFRVLSVIDAFKQAFEPKPDRISGPNGSRLSPGLISDFRRLLPSLRGQWHDDSQFRVKAICAEWARLARRHNGHDIVEHGELLMRGVANLKYGSVAALKALDPWEVLLRALEIACFLARE